MNGKRIGLIVAVVLFLVLLLVGALAAKPLAKAMLVKKAQTYGLILESVEVDLGWGWIRIRDAQLVLEGAPGITVKVERATVDFSHVASFQPSRVEARSPSMEIVGSPAAVADNLRAWLRRYEKNVSFPVVAEKVGLRWSETKNEAPWLELTGKASFFLGKTARFSSEQVSVEGKSLGPVDMAWSAKRSDFTLTFGKNDSPNVTVEFELDETGKVKMALLPVASTAVGQLLGMKVPLEPSVLVQATGEFRLPSKNTEIQGMLSVVLQGYVPPHPRELQGIIYGNVTTFDSSFRLSADRQKLRLEKASVKAGALVLDGNGDVERHEGHATVVATMSGDVPCTALVKTASAAHLGKQIGGLIGGVAKMVLAGSVGVTVKVVADTRDLEAAKVQQSTRIACALRLP